LLFHVLYGCGRNGISMHLKRMDASSDLTTSVYVVSTSQYNILPLEAHRNFIANSHTGNQALYTKSQQCSC
jgi:hypothetical protein